MTNSSKRRRNKKAATAGAVLLAVMLATSACGGGNTNAGNEQQGSPTDGPVITQLPEDNGVIDPDLSSPEPTDTATNNNGTIEDPAAPNKVNEGIYSGLSDSHSIEIETAAGAIALQVTDDQKSTLEALPDDAKVKFEYSEKAIEGEATLKQNWLVKIEEIK